MTRSYYEFDTSPSALYSQGCSAGRSAQSGVVILDFGRPAYQASGDVYGTVDFGGHFDSNASQVGAAEAYARGYVACVPATSAARVAVAIGTNNSCSDQDPACHGAAQPASFTTAGHWAAVAVGRLHDYLVAYGLSGRVRASAADDAEPAWDPAYTHTRDLLDGFAATSGQRYPLWDFGSLESGSWTRAQEYHVAYGAPPDVPFGEIYYAGMADEWEGLDLWAVQHTGRPLYVYGVTTQYNAPYSCGYTPGQSDDQMLRALQSHASTYQSSIPYETDVPCSTG